MHEIYGKQFGIDIPEWRTLVTIGSFGSANAHKIVLSTRTNKSTISRAVQKLKDRGWIVGEERSEDRRNVELRLTGEGKAVYSEIATAVLAIEEHVLDAYGSDLKQLNEIICRLESALDIGNH